MCLQAFLEQREGYTPVRLGTAEERAAAAADASATGDGREDAGSPAAVGYATGIDDFDVAVDAEGPAVDVQRHQLRAAESALAAVLQSGGVLVSAEAGGGGLLSDYDRDFAPLTHPTVFPYGDGGRPAQGMSEDAYFRLVLERRAASGRGDNVGMLLAFYDIQARHAVNAATSARARATPEVFAELDGLEHADLCAVYEALRAGARDDALWFA